ncbi:hypothetical protein CW745_16140 [Psychromonas sp. psych-6C06]|uniref:hypothetical protein n=1 Tax=Psychromonas sp. psych-6C06 TaxID=2058089 RepID=UPI000C335FFF|nr:hypothetical protein [Psychromonas sp. psych-6C06]PKF60201.1 hypothetical protein CW745_16140 [Psychromonas sp. psych-6C06]
MKKLVLNVVCLISILASSSAFATAKVGIALDQGFGVAGQFENINAFIGNDGLSGDYLINQGDFGKDIPFNWYVGGGAYYNWSGNDNIGARVPLGLTLPFAKKWDVYGQLAPALEYDLDNNNAKFRLDFAVGIRYAF